MKLGTVIREERLRVKLTQAQLAARLGVGADVISKYECDRMTPSLKRLQSLASVFGKTMDELAKAS